MVHPAPLQREGRAGVRLRRATRFRRDCKRDGYARALTVCNPDAPAVALDQPFADGKAQAASRFAPA